MLSKNGHNSSACAFSEEIVSYIYDEASVSEKAAFVAHLDNCLSCSKELTGFGFARSSIQEWRDEEVLVLDMPKLDLPVFEIEKTKTKSVVEVSSGSWLDNLRGLFSISPKLAFGSAAFAILAVCGLSALFILNSQNNLDVASNTNKNSRVDLPTPSVNSKPESSPASSPKEEVAEKENFVEKQKSFETLPEREKSKQTRLANSSRKTKTVVPKNNETMAEQGTKNRKPRKNNQNDLDSPKLYTPDEDDDDSLRLADLFEEIGTE